MNKSRRRFISICAVTTTVILSIVVVIGWLKHSNVLRSVIPGTIAMKFNAAMAFIFSSIALLFYYFPVKNKMRNLITLSLAVVVSLIGLLTLAEYFFGFNIGIDELFVKDDLNIATTYYAGRMSPLSAINFLLIGIGLLLFNKEKTSTYQFFYLSGIAFISLLMLIVFNFIADIPTFVNLSIYDAIGFMILSSAIYIAQPMLLKKISFEQKLVTGFAAIIILISVLSIFSSYYSDKRISTSQWVKHTNEVLAESEQILSGTKEIESEGRGYVITGDSNYLMNFMIAEASIFKHDKKLKDLTKDNPVQEFRIDSLTTMIDKRISFSLRYIKAKNEQGFEAAKELIVSGQGTVYSDAIKKITSDIRKEENILLIERQMENNKSIVSFKRAFYVLLGSILVLLVIIVLSIRRNVVNRKKAEKRIKESERMFSTLFYKSPVLKSIIESATGKYVAVNDSFVNFLGQPRKDIIGKTAAEMNVLTQPEKSSRILNDIREHGCVRELEMQINSNGNIKWVSANIDRVNLNGKDCILSAGIDITKRKVAEEKLLNLSHELEAKVLERTRELQKSEKRYRYLFENSPMPMWVIDLNTFKFLDINEMAIVQYGYSREEFLSMTTLDIRPDSGKDLFKKAGHLKEMNGTNYAKGIWDHRKKDGTIMQVEIIAHKIIFEGVDARLVLSNDVSEKKKAQEKLDKSEKLFRAIIEKGADMKMLAARDGKVLYTSPSITKILGYGNEEFKALSALGLIRLHDVRAIIKKVANVAQTPGESFYHQLRLKHKNGNLLWCEGTITNMLHEPAVAAYVVNFRDITARKEAEAAVKLVQASYREIFDKASDAIYVHEIETGRIIEVNEKATRITGYSREELLNTDPRDLFSDNPDYSLEHAMNYLQKAAAGEPQLFEWMGKNKDNSINWLEVNLKRATIAGKERILAFFREINDRKKARFEIETLNNELEKKVINRTAELEQVNKELEAFSYSVSHDLRAPLRAINGFSKIIIEKYDAALDNEGKRLFFRIKENAKKMGSLIDDLLEFSRLGRKEIHKSPIEMTELVEATVLEMNTTVTHEAVIKINQLHSANADNTMIKQVIVNLISNAIKYSSKKAKPAIEVRSYLEKNEIIYSVSDNGAGFNNLYVHKLFGVFQRLHLKADFEGTGVGLALVKRIIDKHGGRVWAAGELNKGATFCFSLPATINN